MLLDVRRATSTQGCLWISSAATVQPASRRATSASAQSQTGSAERKRPSAASTESGAELSRLPRLTAIRRVTDVLSGMFGRQRVDPGGADVGFHGNDAAKGRLRRGRRRILAAIDPVSSDVSDATDIDVARLPLVPRNPLPIRERGKAARQNHFGQVSLREAGGAVTRLVLGPRWLAPPIVFVMSPTGARDVLARQHESCDRTLVHQEIRRLCGDNLADLPNTQWRPRKRTLQPVFSRHHVSTFGGHMAEAAAMIARGWGDGANIDLDTEARRLTMRVLGRSVLGIDLDERAEALAEPLNITVNYVSDRGMRPIRAPWWLPTPARHRARAAVATLRQLAGEVLAASRAGAILDAPLVNALIGATDPETGRALSDLDICNDLIAFMFAGHDTTATTLAFVLWALGRHPEIQNRVAEEVGALDDRPLTPDDVSQLGYTGQVVSEALRLCPPVPIGGRAAMRDIAVDGYRVEAGSMVLVGIFGAA